MADRTFHKRFTFSARVGVVVFALLAGYFFWVKVAIIGILVAIVIVGLIERVLNTTFTFKRVKPIDRDDEMEYLIINEGRFSPNKNVPVCDIISVKRVNTFFGLDHCLVIEYGHHNMVTVQPDNEEAFEREIKKRQESEERKEKKISDNE